MLRQSNIHFFLFPFLLLSVILLQSPAYGQFSESTLKENNPLFHGVEQYNQELYNLTTSTFNFYLHQPEGKNYLPNNPETDYQKARYFYILSLLQNQNPEGIVTALNLLPTLKNPYFQSKASFNIAQYYFRKKQLKEAIDFYNRANIDYLSNEDIATLKFELAYSYFNNQEFAKAKPLFATIKELPKNKYYLAGNYYYGLLAYNDKEYKQALTSFQRINKEQKYQEVVPYYEAEIYYFLKDYKKVLSISRSYLKNEKYYYHLSMQLLTAQTLFEQEEYAKALPYFEAYYNKTDKIKKDILYEIAYTYYQLEKWDKAISRFQPLSNSNNTLGQTAMYLLGDCYLKTLNKQGARNAFDFCSNMDFNPKQKADALFLYAKLSADLGYESVAMQKLSEFINLYPQNSFQTEAKGLLSGLLIKSNNYAEAFEIINNTQIRDFEGEKLYQKIAVGYAFQLIQSGKLSQANQVLDSSLKYSADPTYSAIAYFWKGEIAYRTKNYSNAVDYIQTFLNSVSDYSLSNISKISKQATKANAQSILGHAEMQLGNYKKAQSSFAQAGKNAGQNSQLAIELTLQEADAYFMQQNFLQAEKLYRQVANSNNNEVDYAKYQLAITKGLLGDTATKIQLLSEIAKQPASAHQSDALYELALNKLHQGKNSEAVKAFESLINRNNTPESMKAKSLIQLANTHRLNNNPEDAILNYQKFLKQYPTDTARELAIDAVKEIYVRQGTPETFIQFLADNNLPNPDSETIENTYYDAAIRFFSEEKWEATIQGFNKYLEQFANGKNHIKAYYYRGISYNKTKQLDKALSDFEFIIDAGWSDFSEDALNAAAHILATQKNYSKANGYYSQILNNTHNTHMLEVAYTGLMETEFKMGNYEKSKSYADTLLTLPTPSEKSHSNAHLHQARSLQKMGKTDEALILYKQLDKANIGAISAEARYRIAETAYDKGEIKEAEKLAEYAAKNSSGQTYWIEKCYILLSDILTKQKDYFSATAILKDIVKKSNIEELKEEAKQKLQIVQDLEKGTHKLSEE